MDSPNEKRNIFQTHHRGSGKRVQKAAGAVETVNSRSVQNIDRIEVKLYFRE